MADIIKGNKAEKLRSPLRDHREDLNTTRSYTCLLVQKSMNTNCLARLSYSYNFAVASTMRNA